MFSSIQRARIILSFLSERFADYAHLARYDLLKYRHELIRSILGACICAAAGLGMLCFLGIAILVTNWDTPHRVLTAWLVCAAWALMMVFGVIYARLAMRHSSPFDNIGLEISRDLAAIKESSREQIDPEPARA